MRWVRRVAIFVAAFAAFVAAHRWLTTGTVAVATAAAATTLTLNIGDPGGAGISCDQTISAGGTTGRDQLSTALNSAGSDGDTICVTADLSGSRIDLSTDFTTQTRAIAQPADGTITIPGVGFGTSSKVTIQGFEVTGERNFDMGSDSNDAHIIQNYCHDQELSCINGTSTPGGIDGLWVMGNRFERIDATGATGEDQGYGMVGQNWRNNRVEYNTCDQGSDGTVDFGGDCFQLDSFDDSTFIGNYMINHSCVDCDAHHNDGFMIWNGSVNVTIEDNVSLEGLENLISPDGTDNIVHNNLMAEHKVQCLTSGPNDAGDIAPLRFIYTNNTIFDCGSAFTLNDTGIVMNGSLANAPGVRGTVGGDNVWEDNIFSAASCVLAGFDTAPEGNIIYNGDGCGLNSSLNSLDTWVPNWNGTDFASADYDATYQPTNLPTGYEGAGYHPAPVGYEDCETELPAVCDA